jgi:hypothetical protein
MRASLIPVLLASFYLTPANATMVALTRDFPPNPIAKTSCAPLVKGALAQVINNPDSDSFANDDVPVIMSSWQPGCDYNERIATIPKKYLKTIPDPQPARADGSHPPLRIQITQANLKPDCLQAGKNLGIDGFLKVGMAVASQQKTSDQIDDFLKCYPTDNQADYENTYRRLINLAADKFQVDASEMKCLLRREGTFDKNKISCRGALGLGQQVVSNARDIAKQIGDSAGRLAAGRPATEIGPERKENDLIRMGWDSYMGELRNSPHNDLRGCTGNFEVSEKTNPPPSVEQASKDPHRETCNHEPNVYPAHVVDDRQCAAASIAATAVFLSNIHHQLDESGKTTDHNDWETIRQKSVAAMAAYMIGNGNAAKAIRNISDPAKWEAAILNGAPKYKDELANHIRAMHNCLDDDKWDKPWGSKDSKPGDVACRRQAPMQRADASVK